MNFDHILNQAIAELSQIMSEEERIKAAKEYINNMTNVELLELIDRSQPDPVTNFFIPIT